MTPVERSRIPGLIERCLAHQTTFAMEAGESTSVLIHRYTAWREAHADCALPTEETPDVRIDPGTRTESAEAGALPGLDPAE